MLSVDARKALFGMPSSINARSVLRGVPTSIDARRALAFGGSSQSFQPLLRRRNLRLGVKKQMDKFSLLKNWK